MKKNTVCGWDSFYEQLDQIKSLVAKGFVIARNTVKLAII